MNFKQVALAEVLCRGKVFNNIFSEIFSVCSTWPSGKAMARRGKGPEFDYGRYLIFFYSSSFLLFLYL